MATDYVVTPFYIVVEILLQCRDRLFSSVVACTGSVIAHALRFVVMKVCEICQLVIGEIAASAILKIGAVALAEKMLVVPPTEVCIRVSRTVAEYERPEPLTSVAVNIADIIFSYMVVLLEKQRVVEVEI